METKYDVFISYSRSDLDSVKQIKSELERTTGANFWMDLEGIESGEQFKRVIISAINRCDMVLFMLSNYSMNSSWALDELSYAKYKGKRLVILHVRDVQMTDEFYFTYNKYDQIVWNSMPQRKKLIRDIKKWFDNTEMGSSETAARNMNNKDSDVQYNYGWMCIIGEGVARNDSDAMNYFLNAASFGHDKAMYILAEMYYMGWGVQQSYSKAMNWFQKAAERNSLSAQYRLGSLFLEGQGVQVNYGEALKWLQKAAERGHATAQNDLGVMYEDALGVSQNYSEATKWYRKRAEQGYCNMVNDYGIADYYRKRIAWYQQLAENGDPDAQHALGGMYYYGWVVNEDKNQAAEWFRKAAEQGHVAAQYDFGMLCLYDEARIQNGDEKYKWILEAAEQGHPAAQYQLGWIFESGKHVTKNTDVAVQWYRKAAEQGKYDAFQSIKNCIDSKVRANSSI